MSSGGTPPGNSDKPVIEEVPPPALPKCFFCSNEHDPREKCNAMKQALRLKGDWDKEEAAKRKAAQEAAKAAKAAGS